MLKKVYTLFFILILALSASPLFSQNFPVSVNTTITPPYSTYLADYVAPGSQKLALNIFLNDINRPELQTRLRLRIEGQGILIETKPEFLPQPLILQGGIPERLISSDLAPYFLPQNLNFSGITRQQFQRSGQLPEGLYSICFEVLEYNRGVKVSNSGCTMAWLILNDPPLINLPMQAEKLKPQEPQYVTFQWTPRHTGSPNSAFSTEYEFTLVELWPESRNPNDAILTSPPIYQTTTQSTTLIYGPAETPLVPGRRYAFRVKAKSISGIDELDLFKNQGYSQVHSFQYGDACDIPGNIQARTTNSGAFKVIYEPNTNHTAFSIRYRKANDPKATWYEVDSYFEEIEINGLQPETTYEYQLSAGCGPFGSEYSPVALVTTDAMPEVTYACGLPPEEFDFGNTEPLPTLQRNDILYAGDFNVKILEATGSAGTFTGKGTVVVPYLDNLAVSVEFANITVNTEYRMTAGSMEVKGIGVDVLPDNFTDFLEELDETLASVDDVLGDVSAGLEIADEILGEVGDLANDILDNGPFTTEEEIALDGSSVEKYNEEAKKAINDAASLLGGSATVESIAEAAKKVAQGMALKNRANKLQNIYNNSDTLKVLAVEFYENLSGQGKYGFDIKQHEPHRLHYNIMVLPDNQSVAVPWAATKAGEAASIKAKFLPNDSVKIEDISFRSGADGSTLTAQLAGNEWTITLPPLTNEQSLVINAVDNKGQTVGKLNAIGYEPIERKVHLIPVGGESSISATEVQAELNRIYAQAIASWTVEKHAAIQVAGYDGTLQDDEQVMLSTYSDGMKAIIKAYQATEGVTINDNDFYLFLVGNSQTDKAGYMPRKHRFGFIYQNEGGDIKRTIAHELGHGAFRLQHVWEEYPTISETTANLMDYGTGTNLRKYQWDLIHNPPVVVGLVEDLEEGSYETDGHYSTVYLVCLMLGMDESKAKELAVATEDPDTDIHSETDYELDQTWSDGSDQEEIHSLTGGFHGVEEFFTAVNFLYTNKDDVKKLGELLHRFGDSYAHTKLDNITPNDLTSYELKNHPENEKDAIKSWEGIGGENISDKIEPFIILINRSIKTYGIDFLSNLEIQKNALSGYTLNEFFKTIYDLKPSDQYIMYGGEKVLGTTLDHAKSDGSYPDLIYLRPQWYLSYVKNLAWLISMKYDLDLSNLNIEVFTKMVSFSSTYQCSMKGIIDYEIAKEKSLNSVYIPVFYSKPTRSAASIDAVWLSDYLQIAKDAVINTKKYMKEVDGVDNINIEVLDTDWYDARFNFGSGFYTTKAYRIDF